ncbi:hypothetical protein B0H14DRAFT_2629812 [Mycena olivaceomarginata]|nr:hypothetical protein B0H14DRAFT_2629812 [Mycena olivaceomarginata]
MYWDIQNIVQHGWVGLHCPKLSGGIYLNIFILYHIVSYSYSCCTILNGFAVVMDEGQVGQGRGEGRVHALRAGTGATTSNVTALGTTAALLTPASSELLASATTVPEGGWDDAGGRRVSARERAQAD